MFQSQHGRFPQKFKRPRDVGIISKDCGVVFTTNKSREVEHDRIDMYPPKKNARMDFACRKYLSPRDLVVGCDSQNSGRSFNMTCERLKVGSEGLESRESEQNMIGVNPLNENARRKYPPPRVLKGFVLRRDFPIGCGNQRYGDNSNPIESLKASDGMKSRESECRRMDVNHMEKDVIADIVHEKYPLLRRRFSLQRGFCVDWKNLSFGHLSNPTNRKSIIAFKPQKVNDKFDFDRVKVKKALVAFHDLLSKLMQEDAISVFSKIHVKATMLLRKQLKWISTSKRLGSIPGVEVGDMFQWAAELNVIGLHLQFSSGIDYMKIEGKTLATSIIASGRYSNDVEFSNVLIYSGYGGNPTVSHTQVEDQKLERGNLALKNSMEAKTPVRVIHGIRTSKSSTLKGLSGMKIFKKIYVYDGLYLVDRYWQDRGQFGKLVFKFLLRRISGQPKCILR